MDNVAYILSIPKEKNIMGLYKTFFFFIFYTVTVFAEENSNCQTNFETVHNYLDRFEKETSNFSGKIFLCTLPRTGTNLIAAILSQLTRKECLWSRSHNPRSNNFEKWEKGVRQNRAQIDILETAFPILGSHRQQDFKGMPNNKIIVTLRNYKDHL